jgi:Arc/MetJ-type ribon-helix-helix transcriptional regulator
MQERTGAARGTRITVRLSREEQHKVEEAAKTRGHASPSAFVRAAIQNELNGRREQTGTEERIAGGFDRISKDISRVGRSQRALFALMDTFAKTMLTCVPEPPSDAKPQAIARARDRYDQLMKNAGRSMSGDARSAMQNLVDHGAN